MKNKIEFYVKLNFLQPNNALIQHQVCLQMTSMWPLAILVESLRFSYTKILAHKLVPWRHKPTTPGTFFDQNLTKLKTKQNDLKVRVFFAHFWDMNTG